ncbi:MAG: hypothetical protein BAJALOKI1v1_190014 [Promethearchaeota archaeon]|nr:MAG: hypothetical protein BAJALOKI1v1_190014 [Candidatus Lokiarchaeota archaeon]
MQEEMHKEMQNKSIFELVELLEANFNNLLEVIKSMANDNRLKILISLLLGEKSFEELKAITNLKKTALSNHLTTLMNIPLIERPDHGIYKLKDDALLFLNAINDAYLQSTLKEKKDFEKIQQRGLSDDFKSKFFQSR